MGQRQIGLCLGGQTKQLAECVHKEGLVSPTTQPYLHFPEGYMQILMVCIDEVVVKGRDKLKVAEVVEETEVQK